MKKILYALILCFFVGFAVAQTDISQTLNNSTMPTDDEIRAVISRFDFDKNQKEMLFKETKKKLQELYSSQNSIKTNINLDQDNLTKNQSGKTSD